MVLWFKIIGGSVENISTADSLRVFSGDSDHAQRIMRIIKDEMPNRATNEILIAISQLLNQNSQPEQIGLTEINYQTVQELQRAYQIFCSYRRHGYDTNQPQARENLRHLFIKTLVEEWPDSNIREQIITMMTAISLDTMRHLDEVVFTAGQYPAINSRDELLQSLAANALHVWAYLAERCGINDQDNYTHWERMSQEILRVAFEILMPIQAQSVASFADFCLGNNRPAAKKQLYDLMLDLAQVIAMWYPQYKNKIEVFAPDQYPSTQDITRSAKIGKIVICGNLKTLYELYVKSLKTSFTSSGPYDAWRLRIIWPSHKGSNQDAQAVESIAKAIWFAYYERMVIDKDYYTFPKKNGYRARHLILARELAQPVEIQIVGYSQYRYNLWDRASHFTFKHAGDIKDIYQKANLADWKFIWDRRLIMVPQKATLADCLYYIAQRYGLWSEMGPAREFVRQYRIITQKQRLYHFIISGSDPAFLSLLELDIPHGSTFLQDREQRALLQSIESGTFQALSKQSQTLEAWTHYLSCALAANHDYDKVSAITSNFLAVFTQVANNFLEQQKIATYFGLPNKFLLYLAYYFQKITEEQIYQAIASVNRGTTLSPLQVCQEFKAISTHGTISKLSFTIPSSYNLTIIDLLSILSDLNVSLENIHHLEYNSLGDLVFEATISQAPLYIEQSNHLESHLNQAFLQIATGRIAEKDQEVSAFAGRPYRFIISLKSTNRNIAWVGLLEKVIKSLARANIKIHNVITLNAATGQPQRIILTGYLSEFFKKLADQVSLSKVINLTRSLYLTQRQIAQIDIEAIDESSSND